MMGIVEIRMNTHSSAEITSQCGEINPCIIHNQRPHIYDIVAGKRKEHHFVAVCESDSACNKISMESGSVVAGIWNKWNPVESTRP